MTTVTLVYDVEEHVGSIRSVGEIPDLVDDQDVGLRVAGKGLDEATVASRGGEIVDERRSRHEERVEAVLDGAVRDGNGEVSLAASLSITARREGC